MSFFSHFSRRRTTSAVSCSSSRGTGAAGGTAHDIAPKPKIGAIQRQTRDILATEEADCARRDK
jgi:hypothetical protein